jgi:RHS repeat-associated protein
MASSFASGTGFGSKVTAARGTAVVVLVVTLVWLWAPGRLIGRDGGAVSIGTGAPAPMPGAAADLSEDEGDTAPQLEAEGVRPIHPSVELAPFDHIDLASGNVNIVIPLLSMPGDGLLDLGVTLSFNSKPWLWSIGPGELIETGYYSTPTSVRDGAGTKHEFAQLYGQTVEYLTTEFWHYNNTTHVLQKPNGVSVYYGQYDSRGGGSGVRRPTSETDPFGNTIVYNYEAGPSGSRLSTIVQTLEDNNQRVVSFSYDSESGYLHTMTYGAATWTFEWTDATNLHRVTLATHGAWVFDRASYFSHTDQLTVTTPTGGVVAYNFMMLTADGVWGNQPLGTSWHPRLRRYVTSRVASGPQLPGGTWTFGYPCPDGCQPLDDVTTAREMHDPEGTTTTLELASSTGQATSRAVISSGQTTPLETEDIDPTTGIESMVIGGGDGGLVVVPLTLAKSVTRDGFTYRVEYGYGPRDPGLWADYAQPSSITTYGDFTRTIAITYRHSFGSRYIRGKVASVTTVNPAGPVPIESYCVYDDYGFMTSKTVEGITVTYARDQTNGNLAGVTDANNRWRQYDHAWGRTSETRTARYTIWRHFTSSGTIDWFARDSTQGASTATRTLLEHADPLERETLRTPPAGLATATHYDQEAAPIDPLNAEGSGPYVEVSRGVTWTRTFADGYGRTRRTVVNPPTNDDPPTITTTRYDALGRKVFESLPFTDTEVGTSYTYDALGRMKTKTFAGKTTTYSYARSAEGSTVTITEPFGLGGTRTTVQTWQASGGADGGRLVRVHDAKGNDTTYAYNVIDKLTTVHATGVLDREYHYIPGTSRLAYEIQPESGRTDYDYNLNGTLLTKTDVLGHVVTYSYDELNRLIMELTPWDPAYTTSTSYDDPRSDNPHIVANGYVSTEFSYDDATRLRSRTDTIHLTPGDSGRSFPTLYLPNGYDQVDQITYPDGRVVAHGFDDQQRINSVTEGARTYASDIRYHPSGQVRNFTSGNGVPTSIGYDPDTYWPSGLSHGTEGAVLSLGYSYFDEGNVRTITDARPGMTINLTDDSEPVTRDGYDPVDRLRHAVGPWGTLDYGYDAVGNRINRTQAGELTEYKYDPSHNNRLATTMVGGVVTEGFWYNDLGQLTEDGRGLYSYTPAGLLETAQMGSGLTVTHRYDGDGMRAVKVIGSVPHYYVHGPGGQLLSEYEVAGGQLMWVVDYVYAGGRLLAAIRPDVSYIVTIAKTGSGRVTTDPAGLDCGATCSAAYPAERTITLTAVPDSGSGFTGWGGSCSGTSPNISLTVTAVASCTATFSSSATLLVTAGGSGSGTAGFSPAGTSCGAGCATFAANTEVTLSATPASDAVLSGWSGDPDCADGHVTMNRAKGCTAVFTRRVALTVAKSGAGTVTSVPGGIDCGTSCSGSFAQDSTVRLTATAAAGSIFAGWSGDCTSDGVALLSAARSCLATFTEPPSYTLTIAKTGDGSDGSTVTSSPSGIACEAACAASFSSGTSVALSVEPAEGYEFVGWQGTGCDDSVLMTQARTCTAVFQALPCDPDGSQQQACRRDGGTWDDLSCSCQYWWEDPLVLRLDGGPIRLTSLAGGVPFDVDGDGQPERIAWTRAGTGTAFLTLDLDGDGLITSGAELLGMPVAAPRRQRPGAGENSFTLLAAYDEPANGGNGDGMISAADAVFARLRLWQDVNHDGISQPDEFVPLTVAGIVSIELDYRPTGRRDGLGNFYRYRGVVHLQSGRTVPIWDVFLATRNNSGASARPSGFQSQASTSGPGPDLEPDSDPVAADASAAASWVSRADGVDPPPASERVEFYHLDVLGSVRAVTDAQGRVIGRHDFMPFGEEWSAEASGLGSNPVDKKLFTGKERDTELDLDYFGARYYRTELGRFTTVDPELNIKEALVDPQRWNRYAYVASSPLLLVDPDGRAMICATPSCQQHAQQTVALQAEYNSASGWSKVWAGIKLVMSASADLPVPMPMAAVAVEAEAAVVAADGAMSAEEGAGSFSIINWEGYPSDLVPTPSGPFRLIEGAEYSKARATANAANRAIHGADSSLAGKEIHEIQPIKVGGSPTSPANKIALAPKTHRVVTSWWNNLINTLQRQAK